MAVSQASRKFLPRIFVIVEELCAPTYSRSESLMRAAPQCRNHAAAAESGLHGGAQFNTSDDQK